MNAYFDSPETIRNKYKELKSATIGGINKQDVINYLSVLSEQQGVMIKIIRENNIPLRVDSGYDQEEDFIRPSTSIDGKDNLLSSNDYLEVDVQVQELQAEIEVLKAELAEYKSSEDNINRNTSKESDISEFDSMYLQAFSSQDTNKLNSIIEEKDLYIKQLEEEINSMQTKDDLLEETSSISDIDKKAYEDKINKLTDELTEVQAELNALVAHREDELDIFVDNKSITNNESKEFYDKEIAALTDDNTKLKNAMDKLSNELSNVRNEKELLLKEKEDLLQSSIESNEILNEEVSRELTSKIETLKDDILNIEKENISLNIKIQDLEKELSSIKSFKDENGELISLKASELFDKYKVLLGKENSINEKLAYLKEMENKIEENKNFLEDDFVENAKKKEKEIENLHKQMNRMLIVAQETADSTQKEASDKAKELLDNAKEEASSIVQNAISQKESMITEAKEVVNSANLLKSNTEEELQIFREETRKDAEDMVMNAEKTANDIINKAKEEAETIQEKAINEVDAIMEDAKNRADLLDEEIKKKELEIEDLKNHYLKVKNENILSLKDVYNRLENIIYDDENC